MKSLKLLVSAALLTFAASTFAGEGEYDNLCVTGLAFGKEVPTDCSLNAKLDGKTYCFSGPGAQTAYEKDPQGTVAKANATFANLKK